MEFNHQRRYKRAPTEAERRVQRAKEWQGNYTPHCPKGYQRLSRAAKMPPLGTPVIVKTSDGRTQSGKFKGYTYFPFAGDYAEVAIKGVKPNGCYADQKVFFKEKRRKK
jgi:hypothetical protein